MYVQPGEFLQKSKLNEIKFNTSIGRGPIIDIFYLVFVWLFLYHSLLTFKCPVILSVTLGLIFDGNVFNFSVHTHIRDPL